MDDKMWLIVDGSNELHLQSAWISLYYDDKTRETTVERYNIIQVLPGVYAPYPREFKDIRTWGTEKDNRTRTNFQTTKLVKSTRSNYIKKPRKTKGSNKLFLLFLPCNIPVLVCDMYDISHGKKYQPFWSIWVHCLYFVVFVIFSFLCCVLWTVYFAVFLLFLLSHSFICCIYGYCFKYLLI